MLNLFEIIKVDVEKNQGAIMKYDVVVIGGGPAGMSASIESAKTGAKTLLIERNNKLGGILNQCIHNGFGLHYFNEELTGPEYAYRFKKLVENEKIDVLLNTFVINVEKNIVNIVGPTGAKAIETKAVVYSMGCRERTAGAIKLAGSRPAGVYTAGLAQEMVNLFGMLPGKKVVILGSGDIGLIMARRLTFEGAKVLCVCEIMKNSSGLPRNIQQGLNDFDIPLYFNTTISKIVGKERVCGVCISKVDENLKIIPETEKFLECDCVILSVGLIPETEIMNHVEFNQITGGVVVDEYRQTSVKGEFACGNVLHVHDLVDKVTLESKIAGTSAASFALGKLNYINPKKVLCGNKIRYTVPNIVYPGNDEVEILFRVTEKVVNCNIIVECENRVISKLFKLSINPGEMEQIKVKKSEIKGDIKISIKDRI